MFEFIKNRASETSTWIGIATLVAYIVMWFTPDDIDIMIMKFIEMIGGSTILGGAAFNIFKKD